MYQLPSDPGDAGAAEGKTPPSEPNAVLGAALQRAERHLDAPIVAHPEMHKLVSRIARGLGNRAIVRVLMACSLSKICRPQVDIRKPYTEIGTSDSFSGRTYDTLYVGEFCTKYRLPVNPTTAFLTPALRNINAPLALPMVIIGRPKSMYADMITLLGMVEGGELAPGDLLAECIRELLILRNEQDVRLAQLLNELATVQSEVSLSSEDIIKLIEQHLDSKHASRLPVLVVAAIYQAAFKQLGEQAKPLQVHNAADRQTKALGDVEITLVGDDKIVTTYEMKDKEVTIEDIHLALAKLQHSSSRPDNYIFVTTEPIDKRVVEYARGLYKATGGVEFAVLNCIAFLRHFLHLFHRSRLQFLEAYQALVLAEPISGVSQPLKEAFLSLRRAAEYDNNTDE
jgi:DNA adenine methylase